jgi:hypothetical protein
MQYYHTAPAAYAEEWSHFQNNYTNLKESLAMFDALCVNNTVKKALTVNVQIANRNKSVVLQQKLSQKQMLEDEIERRELLAIATEELEARRINYTFYTDQEIIEEYSFLLRRNEEDCWDLSGRADDEYKERGL